MKLLLSPTKKRGQNLTRNGGPHIGADIWIHTIVCKYQYLDCEENWRVPNPPGANPLVAERAPWRSSQSCVTGGQQPI